MTRALVTALLLSTLSTPALAKYVCPPGSFVLHPVADAPEPLRSGLVLELGAGRVELTGLCTGGVAGRFHRQTGGLLGRVRARWMRCERVRPVSLRARFDLDALRCMRLAGTLRLGRHRFPVLADRVPACGNGLREPGEQCDGGDSAGFGTCCTADCTVKPECPLQCDRDHFSCGELDMCIYSCGSAGVCWPRAKLDCDSGPVCGCDAVTTYPDICAAWADGTGASSGGTCRAPEPPRRRF